MCYINELVICDIMRSKPMLHGYGFCSCYHMAAPGYLFLMPPLLSLFTSSISSVGSTLDNRISGNYWQRGLRC